MRMEKWNERARAKCPTCGTENEEGSIFCNHCGTKLKLTSEDDVKNAVVKRFEAIKSKDEAAIKALMDVSYIKFDDWPPINDRMVHRPFRTSRRRSKFSQTILTN
jgi:hypothetical protein